MHRRGCADLPRQDRQDALPGIARGSRGGSRSLRTELRLDHIIVAVTELGGAAAALESDHGLMSVDGGRHPRWGTANRIVALGDSYLELVAVVDEHKAESSRFGRWVAAGATRTGRAIGWAVRPTDLDVTAMRLGLTVESGSRTRLSGERIEWRTAGIDVSTARPWLPFFIEWTDPASFPGTTATPAAAITVVEVDGDARELSAWLGAHDLPLRIRAGSSRGVTRVGLDGPRGRFAFEG